MKQLVILGGGESGVGTALLGLAKGYEVFVSDRGSIIDSYKKVLLHHARVSRNCDIGGALRACEGGHVLGRAEDDH